MGFGLWLRHYLSERITILPVTFAQLPGWSQTDTRKSFAALQRSCHVFLKRDATESVGSQKIALRVGDWQPACKAALLVNAQSKEKTRAFFHKWFTPHEFYRHGPIAGLFTAYYLPRIEGSMTKSKKFSTPIYGLPRDRVTIDLGIFDKKLARRHIVGRVDNLQVLPYYTRRQIDAGLINDVAPVLLWVQSPIDRLFLEIEGSGVIEFPDKSILYIGYAGTNGAAYTSLAAVMIEKGLMTRNTASMQSIREYAKAHPKEIQKLLEKNASFVFFRPLLDGGVRGSQGVVLTPGYSLAVDLKWVPLGVPIWLDTQRPNLHTRHDEVIFRRLMIAQDTGGAIRGAVRGDVFWGAGMHARAIEARMKNTGRYWLLLPRAAAPGVSKQ